MWGCTFTANLSGFVVNRGCIRVIDPAGVSDLFIKPVWMQRGDVQMPTALFLGKEGIVLREVEEENFSASASADGQVGRAQLCSHVLLSWSVASWNSNSETSQLKQGWLLVCPCCLT